ncbi:MAG: hydrogenase maturation nickel metallochaperone HypA [Magnetovibrionaceae bacterium]
MHEMSLTEGIRTVLEEQAVQHQFSRVKTVWLEIGALSSVEVDALTFAFDVVMKGSIAEEAELKIVDVPGKAWCMDCSETVPINERYDPCPKCSGHKLTVTSGDEMRIKELEVD